MSRLPVPLEMTRDNLWTKGLSRLQLEFVVDNESLANVSNGIASVANEFYRAPLDRIRTRLLHMFRDCYEYKASFLDPVDWKPREFNRAADHIANCILDAEKRY